ncbi:MAG: hypothetical protein LBB48_01990 [Treponema sp.]|nr:hypothetical protein [Treponema sp.]
MKQGMKRLFFLALLLIIPALCFAADYYAEYSFAEADKIDSDEIHGINGWEYEFVYHWTKAEIQDFINRHSQSTLANRRKAAEYMSRMLRASADKRIFVIDTSVEYGPQGRLFIKINENEYVVFFTGN